MALSNDEIRAIEHEAERGLALLKSVVSPHDEPVDRCRHCLAVEEIDQRCGQHDVAAHLAEFQRLREENARLRMALAEGGGK